MNKFSGPIFYLKGEGLIIIEMSLELVKAYLVFRTNFASVSA